jgi:hypothetical protein
MRQFERYIINFAQITDPGGTHEKPKLLQMTNGERSEESVIYHMKIGQLYQQMHINVALDLTNPELKNLNNWEVLYHPPKFSPLI